LEILSSLIVTNITGDHWEGYSNADVRGFDVFEQNWAFLPSGIENFFPNLESVSIYQTAISSISASDLKSFPKLTSFYLTETNIKSLPGDLFKYNPLIENVQIDETSITKVGEKIFDNLKNLVTVHFAIWEPNNCTLEAKSKDEIIGLKQKFKTECKFQ
jgi:Leucine-rich repeat (LRR) protein